MQSPLPCTDDFGTAVVQGNGAIYRAAWVVQVL